MWWNTHIGKGQKVIETHCLFIAIPLKDPNFRTRVYNEVYIPFFHGLTIWQTFFEILIGTRAYLLRIEYKGSQQSYRTRSPPGNKRGEGRTFWMGCDEVAMRMEWYKKCLREEGTRVGKLKKPKDNSFNIHFIANMLPKLHILAHSLVDAWSRVAVGLSNFSISRLRGGKA